MAEGQKGPEAFRTISEVAEELSLPQHVLRFWETRFHQIKPLKRAGGRRYYRPDEVDLLKGIRILLYEEGFTIRGVQRLLKDKGSGFITAAGRRGSVDLVAAQEGAEPQRRTVQPTNAEGEEEGIAQGHEPPTRSEPGGPGLPPEARSRLEAVVADLLHAKRLLDQVR